EGPASLGSWIDSRFSNANMKVNTFISSLPIKTNEAPVGALFAILLQNVDVSRKYGRARKKFHEVKSLMKPPGSQMAPRRRNRFRCLAALTDSGIFILGVG